MGVYESRTTVPVLRIAAHPSVLDLKCFSSGLVVMPHNRISLVVEDIDSIDESWTREIKKSGDQHRLGLLVQGK